MTDITKKLRNLALIRKKLGAGHDVYEFLNEAADLIDELELQVSSLALSLEDARNPEWIDVSVSGSEPKEMCRQCGCVRDKENNHD